MSAVTFPKPLDKDVSELNSNIGSLSSLTTAAKASTVAAINEIDARTSDSIAATITWAEYTTATDVDCTYPLTGWKMLSVEISWYSTIGNTACIPIAEFKRGQPFILFDASNTNKVILKYISDTKINILCSAANVRCNVLLSK